jgi:CRP-like cAMP-binding protein
MRSRLLPAARQRRNYIFAVGAVAVYESRPYPATALTLEPTTCVLIPRQAFFSLLETYPTMVRGLLTGLTHRLAELTNRLTELSDGRVESRLARFFLKLGSDIGFVLVDRPSLEAISLT